MHIAKPDRTVPLVAFALLALVALTGVVINGASLASSARSDTPRGLLAVAAAQRPPNPTDALIWSLQDRIRRSPTDADAHALLGAAYVQRARETGDPTYYAKADAAIDTALRRDAQNVEALIGKGTLALARHEFREALAIGEQARALNPTIPRIYGVIADAQFELGMYDEALHTTQQMVDLRPDLGSYTRVSYARELHGDIDGAIEAMGTALRAGGAHPEQTQWVRVQLGNLFFNRGDLAAAEQQYDHALAALPDYVPAIAGRGRVAAARGDTETAIRLYADATQRMPLPEYVIALGDMYTSVGDQERAAEQYALVRAIDRLANENGVNTDLETALFMADHDLDLAAALARARAAYDARPSIHAADALAWTLYHNGDYAEAQRYSDEALRLGTRDPLKLFHAGMIAHALGQRETARAYLRQALALNPHFSPIHAPLAARTLEQLGGS